MRIFPISENDDIILETEVELKLIERAAVTSIFKEYNLYTDKISNEKQRRNALDNNIKVLGRCKYYGVYKIIKNKNITFLDDIPIIDVKKEIEERKRLELAEETSLNFNDLFK